MAKVTLLALWLALAVCSSAEGQALRADIDRDGDVDFQDFLILANEFGQTGLAATSTVDTVFVPLSAERPPEQEWNDVRESLSEAVYWLGVIEDTQTSLGPRFLGTGFAIESDLLATNFHVAAAVSERLVPAKAAGFDPAFIAVRDGGRASIPSDVYFLAIDSLTAVVTGFGHPLYDGTPSSPDLAIVGLSESEAKVFPASAPLIPFREAKALRVGDEIATLGFPGELEILRTYQNTTAESTFKNGVISALRPYNPSITGSNPPTSITDKMVQHNFSTTGGTSGSPVVNRRGEVIAVHNSSSREEPSLGFAIRADELREMMQAIAVLSDTLTMNSTKLTVE